MRGYLSFIILAINCIFLGNSSFAGGPCVVSAPSIPSSLPAVAAKMPPMPSVSASPISPTTLPDAHPTVIHGSLDIKTTGASMDMHAGAGKTIANFNGFGVGRDAKVTVNMGASDAVLARNMSGEKSHIMGELNVPQGVFALQGQEIVMHNGAVLNIGEMASFVGVAGHVTDESFLSGNMAMTGMGSIHNAAQVNIKEKGFFGLFGRSVTQTGHIAGEMATVSLSKGDAATLSFAGNDLVGFVLPDEKSAKAGSVYVKKDAKIETQGGNVYITAQAAAGAVESVVRVDGVVRASAAHNVGGKIILGGPSDQVEVSGTVESTGDQAGDIIVGGKNITIKDTARFDTSGETRAGLIQIGGRRIRKGSNPFLWRIADVTADTVEIQEGAEILSRRYGDGRAGDIFVIARKGLNVKGAKFDMRSWGKGDGGFLELSVLKGQASFNDLDMSRVLFKNFDETATPGQLLFDPDKITVVGEGEEGGLLLAGEVTIESSAVQTALAQGDVLLSATRNVTVSAPIEWSSRYALVLAATNSDTEGAQRGTISIQARIEMLGSTGKLLLWQGAGKLSKPNPVINGGGGIEMASDNYVIYSVPQPNEGVPLSELGSGVDTSKVYQMIRPSSGNDYALLMAIKEGRVSGSGVHVPKDFTVDKVGDVMSFNISGYNLTSFTTDITNFTTRDEDRGFYSGSGNMIGFNKITFGDESESMPLSSVMYTTSRFMFTDLEFPGNIISGKGVIGSTLSSSGSLLMDRVNLSTQNITGDAGVGGILGASQNNTSVTLRDITGSMGNVTAINEASMFVGSNNGSLTLDHVTLSSVGNVTSDDKAGIFTGLNAGTLSLSNVILSSVGNVSSSGSNGLFSGESTGSISLSKVTINGTPTVGQAGAANTGLLVGNQLGTFSASDLLIAGATVTGSADSSAGLFGTISVDTTTTLTDFQIRTLTASGLKLLRGTGYSTVSFLESTQIMGVTAGSFDSGSATWAGDSYGAISGQLNTLPDPEGGVIDPFPSNVLLRFFDGSDGTFYQYDGANPSLSTAFTHKIGENTVLNVNPQESAGLPFSVIQFGTVEQENEVTYETFKYEANNDQGLYTYDAETTTLVEATVTDTDTGTTETDTGATETTTTTTETEDPNVSGDLALVDDIGDESADEDLPDDVSDDDAGPDEEDVNDDTDTDTDENENDDDEKEQKDSENKNRVGGSLGDLLADKNNDGTLDASVITGQGE